MRRIFSVADFIFSVSVGMDESDLWENLTNYFPFEIQEDLYCEKDAIFSLYISDVQNIPDEGRVECIAEYENEVAVISICRSEKTNLLINIAQNAASRDRGGWLTIDAVGKKVNLYMRMTDNMATRVFIVNNSLMLLFAMFTAGRKALLMHASVVTCKGMAYMFLGKSGTGKSTHSRLWLQYVDNTSLLNDDNPVVRVMDDNCVRVFGSPWSGKTPCYRNENAVLGGIVKLSQAPVNVIKRVKGVHAYISVLPSASGMKWDKALTEGMHNTLTEIVGGVPVFQLECLPDAEAARLCSESLLCLNC